MHRKLYPVQINVFLAFRVTGYIKCMLYKVIWFIPFYFSSLVKQAMLAYM